MKKYFIRSGITPNEILSTEEMICRDIFGGNTGNLLYAYSIYRTLTVDNTVKFEANYYKNALSRVDELNEECDAFIIPLADAFRKDFVPELNNLTEFVKKLKIPCIVTGVGLRAPYEPDFSTKYSFDDDVSDFVCAVLEKSSKLGLRGEITAEYLKRLGFKEEKDYTIIGCPSMYSYGRDLPYNKKEITRDSTICYNSSIYIPHEINDFIMENQQKFNKSYFIAQQTAEYRLSYAGYPYNGAIAYGNYPAKIDDKVFKDDSYRCFFNVREWIDFMKSVDFSFGGRLHGNIAAALAGTPNLMIVSDARMRELSNYHGLAHIPVDEILGDKDIFDLIKDIDFSKVTRRQGENFDHFVDFLNDNNLDHIYKNGNVTFAPMDKMLENVPKEYNFTNFALLDEKQKLDRMNSFYFVFNKYFNDMTWNIKNTTGAYENEQKNVEMLRREKDKYKMKCEEKFDSKNAHIVFDLKCFSYRRIREIFEMILRDRDNFESVKIHAIVNNVSDNIVRYCREMLDEMDGLIVEDDKNSITRTKMFPFYVFENNMEFWGKIKKCYIENNNFKEFFLRDYLWKLEQNVLWPYNLDEDSMKSARETYRKLFDWIEDDIIINLDRTDSFHRFHLLDMKLSGNCSVRTNEGNVEILRDDKPCYSAKKIETVLTKFHPAKNSIMITAFLKSPVFNYCEKPILYLEKNGDKEHMEEVVLGESSWSYYNTKEKISSFYSFSIKLSKKEANSFHFYVGINGRLYDTYYYFMPEVVFNNKLKRYRYYNDGYAYKFNKNTFLISKSKEGEAENYQKNLDDLLFEKEREVFDFRNEIRQYRSEHGKIWLYYDCKGVYKDNGYLQFAHDLKEDDGVTRYYVLNDSIEDRAGLFTEEQKKHIVTFGSKLHKLLFCSADKIITAYIEKNNYQPFSDEEYSKLIDVSKISQIIYLQHGVYHAFIPWKYSFDRLSVDKKIVSTKFEAVNDIEKYGFPKNAIIKSNMPRYDFLDVNYAPAKKILYAPSWRKYLLDMRDDEWVTNEEAFKNTAFYRETKSLLSDKSLIKYLDRKGYTLEFKLHPILKRYSKLYELDGNIIKFAKDSVRDEEYNIFITDFSSYIYDYVYLKRKILFFFPDYEEFKSGMSDYNRVEELYEKNKKNYSTTANQAVKMIKNAVFRGARPLKSELGIMDNTFLHRDKKARTRIYNSICEK